MFFHVSFIKSSSFFFLYTPKGAIALLWPYCIFTLFDVSCIWKKNVKVHQGSINAKEMYYGPFEYVCALVIRCEECTYVDKKKHHNKKNVQGGFHDVFLSSLYIFIQFHKTFLLTFIVSVSNCMHVYVDTPVILSKVLRSIGERSLWRI